MIKVEYMSEPDFEGAVRGMRNPLNSWDKSDSIRCGTAGPGYIFVPGPKDLDLMNRLYNAGPEHRKFMRQIFVTMDITAPLYWWKEFDQYKVGVTTDSCSTMHTITAKEFELDDFSHEYLMDEYDMAAEYVTNEDFKGPNLGGLGEALGGDDPEMILLFTIRTLNWARDMYLKTKDKKYWWQIIQLLPSSYNQKRTVSMSYENAANMIRQRTGHKLDEWNEFVKILRTLPYMEDIIKPREKDGS